MRRKQKQKNRWLAFLAIAAILLTAAFGQTDEPRPFTVVMLPDTQFYSWKYTKYFHDQTEWIQQNAEDENIVFVTHVGDIVQSGDEVLEEWQVAEDAMSRLDETVPWGVAIGNHDYDRGKPPGGASVFRRYFGAQRFKNKSWYGGSSPNELNSYQFFTGGQTKFLIFHLEADVPDEAIAWVKSVIKRHPEMPTIVSTHIYLSDRTKSRTQENYYRKDTGNSGEAIWNKLIKKHPQIFLVLCGHWGGHGGEWYQVSANEAGEEVFEILADYQKRDNGGDGWLRLLTFAPEQNEIRVRTYSPSLGQYETDPDSQFKLWLDLGERFPGRK